MMPLLTSARLFAGRGAAGCVTTAADRTPVRPTMVYLRVLVELDRVNAIFEDAVTPWAMETLSRGRSSGRFAVDDLDLALTSIAGAALAAIRAILAGRIAPGPKTESRGAEMMLRGF